jgi:hypothetical protein
MFTAANFEELYQMLNLDMVTVDCGIKCNKFCCISQDGKTDNTFRYLLPGEAEYVVTQGFHQYADLEDYIYAIRYAGKDITVCSCENIRNYRPFCCRVFPFRPVIDEQDCKVIDIVKASNSYFAPCWITEVLPEWKKVAILAWDYVLSDKDNLVFYATYYYCLRKSEGFSGSYLQAMTEDEEFREKVFALPTLSNRLLWKLSSELFKYILSD